jgi:hypothetical protein
VLDHRRSIVVLCRFDGRLRPEKRQTATATMSPVLRPGGH